jgi:hypothetical protein
MQTHVSFERPQALILFPAFLIEVKCSTQFLQENALKNLNPLKPKLI